MPPTDDTKRLISAPEIEAAVLGAVLVNEEAIDRAISILGPDSRAFSDKRNQTVYDAMLALKSNGEPLDVVSIGERLRIMGKFGDVGGYAYLSELSSATVVSAHISHHCRIVIERAIRRTAINYHEHMIRECQKPDADAFDLLELSERAVADLRKRFVRKTARKDGHERFMEDIHNPQAYLKTGIPKVDRHQKGFPLGDYITLGARPSVGKTAMITTLAKNYAWCYGRPSHIISIEMSEEKMRARFAANIENVDMRDIKCEKPGQHVLEALEQASIALDERGITIEDDCPSDIVSICNSIALSPADIVFVDHLQLIRSTLKTGDLRQQFTQITGLLKDVAKSKNKVLIVASQLTRASEKERRNPQLSDLRESGSIEQDSVTVIFLHEPEKAKNDERHVDVVESKWICAKDRDGETGAATIMFDKPHMRFFDAADYAPDSVRGNDEKNKDLPF